MSKQAIKTDLLRPELFSRLDETDDTVFYNRDRFVSHLDTTALATVGKIIETLIVESEPVILDLMAGWDSHLPDNLKSDRIVGLGLNRNELSQNNVLTEFVLHDLNKEPHMPFPDEHFDVVLNTVSVDYLVQPIQIFQEVGRILKPGGLFLVIFSNRMFPQKAVRVWRESSEEERVLLVQDFFRSAEVFTEPLTFVSKGRPRPENDKYAPLDIPSDPVFAVYAEKKGAEQLRLRRPAIKLEWDLKLSRKEITRRKKEVKHTKECPYCSQKLKKWAVPQSPFTQWDNEFMYVCFNDSCPYLLRGWEVMDKQGNFGLSYRLQYNPLNDSFSPMPIPSLKAFRESIVE